MLARSVWPWPAAGGFRGDRRPREEPPGRVRAGSGGDPGEGPATAASLSRLLASAARPRGHQGSAQNVL